MADSMEDVTRLDMGAWLHVAEMGGHVHIVRVNLGDTRGQGVDRAEGTGAGFMVYRVAFVTVLLVFDLEGYGYCLLELFQADSLLQELLVVPEYDIAKAKGYGAFNCQFWRFCIFADAL
jgi:hypothetical protein